MADCYQKWTAGRTGGFVATRLGLPRPEPLVRYREGISALPGPVVLGGTAGRLLKGLTASLDALGSEVRPVNPPAPVGSPAPSAVGALVFDATGIADPSRLAALYEFFHPHIRSVAPCGRVLILGTPPGSATTTGEAVAQRAIEGFMRSVGKELRRGATANLLQVEPGAEEAVESAVRFVLSPRSA
jgi:3-oxoacyl-[acyl-carrier protein] reductase